MTRELDQSIIDLARKDGDFQVLPVSIYRSGGDCTNGGASSNAQWLYVICPGGYMRASDIPNPIFALERMGDYQDLTEVEIVDGEVQRLRKPGLVGPMAGGNIAHCSDSRWSKMAKYPVPIHDRWETQAQYDALSI